ncbi:MAG: hypothetical protein RL885_05375 [Planctomycetota bacterium]
MSTRFLILIPLLLLACSSTKEKPVPFSGQIAQAHGEEDLYRQPGVAGRLDVMFDGQKVIAGELFFEPSTGRARIDLDEGGRLVFDGERAWSVGTGQAVYPMTRFHLLTWPYFFSAPWKLSDPGTLMSPIDERPLQGERLPSARMTFVTGTGDTPDDWYVVFADPETNALRALAYIVTYGQPLERANEEPHVATYEEYAQVGGLMVPSSIRFWNWNENAGVQGAPIGKATFADIEFRSAREGFFDVPESAVEDVLPQ